MIMKYKVRVVKILEEEIESLDILKLILKEYSFCSKENELDLYMQAKDNPVLMERFCVLKKSEMDWQDWDTLHELDIQDKDDFERICNILIKYEKDLKLNNILII